MDFVSVAIRLKPSHSTESVKSVELVSQAPPIIVVPERQVSFSFDNIFDEKSTQENVYRDMVQPLVKNIVNGYNSTIFAYGQTGTGKTFTIGSDPTYSQDNDAGLILRALKDLMLWDGDESITTHISFVEIYNEKVYDLLNNSKTALQLKGFHVSGVTKHLVLTLQDAQLLLVEGGKNRHTGETKQNLKSSRSHAIFTIYCKVKHLDKETEAKLNLVDLAGCESVKKTGNEGSQLHEGININKGLLCIGQVMKALSSNHLHVPYRESTITTILQDSLNKRNFVTLIACIGTKIDDLVETVQTLDFAQNAKKVRNKPEMNSIVGEYNKQAYANITSRKVPGTPRTPLRPMSNIARKPLVINHNYSAQSTTNLTKTFSSTIQEMPETLSPIVKRCIEAASDKIMKNLRVVMTDLMTPVVEKPRDSQRISPRTLDRVVKQIVRDNLNLPTSEFNTFRDEIDCNRDRSASCARDDDGAEKENHDHAAPMPGVGQIATSPIVSGNMTPRFKKPFTPLRRAKASRRTIAASSPIEKSVSPIRARRSARISSRNESFKMNCHCCFSPKKRGSESLKEDSIDDFTPRRSTRLSTRLEAVDLATPTKLQTRRSTRLSARVHPKQISPQKRKTKVNKKKILNESPIKTLGDRQHTVDVLKTLNDGSLKSIQSLHTIGAKYAAMIIQYRKLKGSFRKISDLSQMPWRGNGYRSFVTANYLVPHTP